MGGAPRGGYRRWFPWGQKIEGMKPRDPLDFPTTPPSTPGADPVGLGSCKAWLIGDTLTATLVDGQAVNFWADQSFNGNSPVQNTSANQGVLKTNQLNGHAVVQFTRNNTTNTWMNSTVPILTPTAGSTLYIVGKRWGSHYEHDTFASFTDTTGSSGDQSQIKETHNEGSLTNAEVKWRSGTLGEEIIIGSVTTNFFIYAISFENSSSATHYYNSTTAYSTFDPHSAADSTNRVLAVGGGNVQLAEVILYSLAHTAPNITSVLNYLSTKYAITLV
jgi:hypothetical protein